MFFYLNSGYRDRNGNLGVEYQIDSADFIRNSQKNVRSREKRGSAICGAFFELTPMKIQK